MTNGCVSRQLSGKRLGHAACGCFAGLLLVAGCSQAPPPVDTKAVEDAVRAADAAWSKAAAALDVPTTASYYADEASVMPPNMPIVNGRDAAQKAWATMLVPGNSISWTANTVKSADSGDLVYVQGTYSAAMKGPNGKMATDTGKYLEVWKKQLDGSWKVVDDIWNSDLPAVAPAAAPAKRKKK